MDATTEQVYADRRMQIVRQGDNGSVGIVPELGVVFCNVQHIVLMGQRFCMRAILVHQQGHPHVLHPPRCWQVAELGDGSTANDSNVNLCHSTSLRYPLIEPLPGQPVQRLQACPHGLRCRFFSRWLQMHFS